MGVEIERKFLVTSDAYKEGISGMRFLQGYLNSNKERVVRVRVSGDTAQITIKGLPKGLARPEYEYEIPIADAEFLLKNICEQPIIEKTRYRVTFAGKEWEIDEFHGQNAGMVVAEIELDFIGEDFELPPWAGQEVSHDWRYFNSNLLSNPYSKWEDK